MIKNPAQETTNPTQPPRSLLSKALLLGLFVVLLVTIPAIAGSSAGYTVDWDTVSTGGSVMTSDHYQMQSTIGQSIIGRAASSSYALGAGYWYGAREPDFTLFLPLLSKG